MANELNVRDIAEAIVAREGGYVDDPSDPGGATNYGVTIHTMRRLGLDLDGDGDVDKADVKLLTRNQATDIFLKHYFFGPGLDRLPKVLQAPVFDMQVNSGANAVKILQRVVNELGIRGKLADDGQIGPKTLAGVDWALRKVVDEGVLRDLYGAARREWYYQVADKRPASRKYARTRSGGKGGWIIRAEEFMSAKTRFSDEQHRQRTASWG